MLFPNSKQIEQVPYTKMSTPTAAPLLLPRISNRWARACLWTATVFCFLLFISLLWFYFTPQGTKLRGIVAEAVYTSKQTKYTWLLVGPSGVAKIKQSYQRQAETNHLVKQDMSLVHIAAAKLGAPMTPSSLVKIEDIKGPTYVGKVMYVKDPRYIHVVASHSPDGEKVSNIAARTGALAAVNGGGFFLTEKKENMAGPEYENIERIMHPFGLIVSEGKLVIGDPTTPQDIVGFTKQGVLISGRYTYEQMKKLDIAEAVSFLPRLVVNGKRMITEGDGGWGVAPRTAIAQKADGTVMVLVIDGRAIHSFGATLKDVQEELLKRGAVNAVNLDGGSSSSMYYKGKIITTPSGFVGEKPIPNAFLIYNPYLEKGNVVYKPDESQPRS
ncbi:phosphodiester glycosidase family protein [Aneurinibacillus tyrosinisolvens]|uniref:phosphodiester glycosidase family protein n=1 Tax=Aneurinibacillus tyrosinisolvens TaxID=1443435 RepID=UPI00069A0D55|nr:phosphodiester glycosidase family protein [Aneurinibacillus tyrosinisolvens]